MTKDKKSDKATAETNEMTKPAIPSPAGIPVALLRFTRPLQVPGRQSDESIKSEKLANGRIWEIEYVPQMRHHRVTYTDPREAGPKVGYVHEVHVLSWEPKQ